jgi:hypothetical protein
MSSMAVSSRLAAFAAVLAAVVLGGGCSKPVKLVPAGGVVEIGGKPAEGILVQFLPQTRDGRRMPTSFGTTGSDGSFALTTHDGKPGAVEGPHAVLLADTLEERPAQGQRATRPVRLDTRYTTLAGGLSAKVADGGEPIRVEVPAAQ